MKYKKERKEIAYFMRRLYQTGLTTTSGGNISMKLADGIILITPSSLDKARITKKQVAIMKPDGTNLTPKLKPSIETGMHLAIYNKRPDVKAIVHAHPTISTAFTATSTKINCCLTAESRAIIGVPIEAPYALMGSPQLAEIVSGASLEGNVILMQNHGILATGKSLLQAFDRLEVLEACAKMSMVTHLLNDRKELTESMISAIDDMMNNKI